MKAAVNNDWWAPGPTVTTAGMGFVVAQSPLHPGLECALGPSFISCAIAPGLLSQSSRRGNTGPENCRPKHGLCPWGPRAHDPLPSQSPNITLQLFVYGYIHRLIVYCSWGFWRMFELLTGAKCRIGPQPSWTLGGQQQSSVMQFPGGHSDPQHAKAL